MKDGILFGKSYRASGLASEGAIVLIEDTYVIHPKTAKQIDILRYELEEIGNIENLEKRLAEIKHPTFYNYINSKQVTLKEIDELFEKVTKLTGTFSFTKCPLCNDSINITKIASEPWTKVLHCRTCKRLSFVAIQDRMAGITEDTLIVYKERSL